MLYCKRELHALIIGERIIARKGKVHIARSPKGNHGNVRIIIIDNGLKLKTGGRESASERQSQFRINYEFSFINAINNTAFGDL
jgi:hypothetical protein